MTDYNLLKRFAYDNAEKHGFHGFSVNHYKMLIITELGEFINAWRAEKSARLDLFINNQRSNKAFEEFIKDSYQDELADCFIRLLDLSGILNYDLSSLNKASSRIYNIHLITDFVWDMLIGRLSHKGMTRRRMVKCLKIIRCIAVSLGFDVQTYVEIKMEYNALRPYRHNKLF